MYHVYSSHEVPEWPQQMGDIRNSEKWIALRRSLEKSLARMAGMFYNFYGGSVPTVLSEVIGLYT